MDPEVERFNKAMSAKYMLLGDAFTRDLVDELSKRDGVSSMKLGQGEKFEFHGPGTVLFISRSS